MCAGPKSEGFALEHLTTGWSGSYYFARAEGARQKLETLCELHRSLPFTQCMVYFACSETAQSIAAELTQREFPHVWLLHLGLSEAERGRLTRHFRPGASGIACIVDPCNVDIGSCSLRINWDLPQCPNCYLHRVGLPVKFRQGTVINLVNAKELELQELLECHFKMKVQECPIELKNVVPNASSFVRDPVAENGASLSLVRPGSGSRWATQTGTNGRNTASSEDMHRSRGTRWPSLQDSAGRQRAPVASAGRQRAPVASGSAPLLSAGRQRAPVPSAARPSSRASSRGEARSAPTTPVAGNVRRSDSATRVRRADSATTRALSVTQFNFPRPRPASRGCVPKAFANEPGGALLKPTTPSGNEPASLFQVAKEHGRNRSMAETHGPRVSRSNSVSISWK